MDGIELNGKPQTSVWGVAVTAVIVFVAIVLIASMFGGGELASVATQQG